MQDTYQYQETARTRQPRRNPQALFFFGWLCAIDWTTNRTAAAAAAGAAAGTGAAGSARQEVREHGDVLRRGREAGARAQEASVGKVREKKTACCGCVIAFVLCVNLP